MTQGLLVFFHGSGGTGRESKNFLENYPISELNELSVIDNLTSIHGFEIDLWCPTAPRREYSPCFGEKLNVWHNRSANFHKLGKGDMEDLAGIEESLSNVCRELTIKMASKNYDWVVLGGFSMGGGFALQFLLKSVCERVANLGSKLIGIFSIGSFLVDNSRVLKNKEDLIDVPILMLHGSSDDLVQEDWGRFTATALLINEINVRFYTYSNVGHDMCDEMLVTLVEFLCEVSSDRETSQQCKDRQLDKLQSFVDEFPSVSKLEGFICNEDQVPYQIAVSDEKSQSTLIFMVSEDIIPQMIARPILACGSSFELTKHVTMKNCITTVVSSPDPHHTAKEIAKRLFVRWRSDSANMNPCPIS